MKNQLLKYLYTLAILFIAIVAVVRLWNYYMESPWTRDGRIHADYIPVTTNIAGVVERIKVKDNQKVTKGQLLFEIIAFDDEVILTTLEHKLENVKDPQSKEAQELRKQRAFEEKYIHRTAIYAPVSGYVTNLELHQGSFISAGKPQFVIVDSSSFYVVGYFEETKLKNIKPNAQADIYVYSQQKYIKGYVDSISHSVDDNNLENSENMQPKIQTNVPWISLAQRIPVKIRLDPADIKNLDLIAGTTCSISIHY